LKKVKVKPSKPNSLLAAIVGVVFVIIGITTFLPMAGFFGVIWTLVALGITGYHLFNLFSKKGVGIYEVDVEENRDTTDFDDQLRRLKKLYDDGIITGEEYEAKKDEILKSKWV